MDDIEIALFPIPGSVTFPHQTLPLHVFEPRYRKMLSDSIASHRRVGVAHTSRVISPSKVSPFAEKAEILSHNQTTYEPHRIFSAGYAELLEIMPDGRMLVQIQMDSRYEKIQEIQQIPYSIVRCKPYLDEEINEVEGQPLRSRVDELILDLEGPETENLKKYITSGSWKNLSVHEYSFKVFSVLSFDPDILQDLLETRSPLRRIQFVKDALEKEISFH